MERYRTREAGLDGLVTNGLAQERFADAGDIIEQLLSVIGEPEVAKYERRKAPRDPVKT